MGKTLPEDLPSLEESNSVDDKGTNKSGDSLTDHLQDFHRNLFERRRARQRNVNNKKIHKTLDALDDDSFAEHVTLDTLNLSTATPSSFIRNIVDSTASYDAPAWKIWWNDMLQKFKVFRRNVLTNRRYIHAYGPYLFLLVGFVMVILSIRMFFIPPVPELNSQFAASEIVAEVKYSDTDAMSLKAFSDTSLLDHKARSPLDEIEAEIAAKTQKTTENKMLSLNKDQSKTETKTQMPDKDELPSNTHEENIKLRGSNSIETYEKMLSQPKGWRPRKYGENQYHHPKIISAGSKISYEKKKNK